MATGPELSHAVVKKILLDAFFTVEEPPLPNAQERFKAGTKRKSRGDAVQSTKQRRIQ